MQSMTSSTPSCVLFSGGLDSAVLLALELRSHRPVYPVHIRSGFAEDAERRAIDRLLASPVFAGAAPLSTLNFDMRVCPETHWAVVGQPPAYDTPDEDVYLEGRNIVLLSKTAILCARLRVNRIALGPAVEQSVSGRIAGILRDDGARSHSASRVTLRSMRR
jgi:7-cyano-7-deazaguanine synthase